MDDDREKKSHGGSVAVKPAYVLLVERELRLQEAIREVIVSEPGFELAAACASQHAALQVIETMPLDVMLFSRHLMDGTGLDLVRAAKKAQPHCAVWVMCTAKELCDFSVLMQAGASGCFLIEHFIHSKPVRDDSTDYNLGLSRMLRGVRAVSEAGDPRKAQIAELSPLQRDVLRCVARGLSNKEIARNLHMSSYNVDYHLKCLRKCFSARNRVQLTMAAMSLFHTDTVPTSHRAIRPPD
jgi:DNA-binding NarL/FixJ family response regulator